MQKSSAFLVCGVVLVCLVCIKSLDDFDEILVGEESSKKFNIYVDKVGVDAIIPTEINDVQESSYVGR